MLRQLFVIVVVMGLGWLLRRMFGSATPAAPRQRPAVPPPEPGGEMVRDRICNTFLPKGSALTSQVAGELHFFCSERCRQAFLSRS